MAVDGQALNPEQLRAAAHGGGPLLIIAGAGTGKTKTLAARVAHLIDTGTAPERILLLTFSRRAAREMLSRAGAMVGETRATRVWGGTFHAVANRLLRMYGPAMGLAPAFTVLDQADAADMMNLIRDELGFGRGPRRFPRKDTLADIYSRIVNTKTGLGEVLQTTFPWCSGDRDGIRSILEAYLRRKRQQSVLDYDDLLLHWHALTRVEGAGDQVVGLFDHILVDEYQDTNAIQLEILREMARASHNLTTVGDDAQAIYSFRAATVRNILEFPSDFPGTEIVRLEQNYRSTAPILDLANTVIGASAESYRKRLWSTVPGTARPMLFTCLDEVQQAEVVSQRVLERRERGVLLREQAVLFRAGYHSDVLEVELARRNIPFVKYGGLKFIESAHIKDLLALLRILENPMDEMSWFRVLQLVEGIGPGHARALMTKLGVNAAGVNDEPVTNGPEGFSSPINRLADEPMLLTSGFAQLDELRIALEECAGLKPAEEIERLRKFYDQRVERLHRNAEARLRDLDQLEQIASGYESRREFITDLTLDPPAATSDLAGRPLLDDDYLILSTIHSAKGCEWRDVHVIHAADGMIPSDMATGSQQEIEEERRLFYVALTRAREGLSIYFALRAYAGRNGRGDRHAYAQLTRFLTHEARARMDQEFVHDRAGASDARDTAIGAASVDLLVEGLLRD